MMKQSQYQPIDFLDLDPDHPGDEILWKAGLPGDAYQEGGDVLIPVPFHRMLGSRDLNPDRESPAREYILRLRAYGEQVLRIGAGFGTEPMTGSEMLVPETGLKPVPLSLEKKEEEWLVKDASGRIRAKLNLRAAETDHWSDLVPLPDREPELAFYPDGKREIRLSTYDQFFPARPEAFPLAFIEKDGICRRAAISFRADPDERFAGTGERFAKSDLAGQTLELRNRDAQGVNNRRCYKNVPFFISSRMTGTFLHTPAFCKISLACHSTRSVQLLAEENRLDLFLIGASTPEGILHLYRQLTGFPAMPPLWSFGTWMSRMSYFSAEEVKEVCRRLRQEDYPSDVIHLDTGWFRRDWLCEWTFNTERFPDPPGFMKELREQGFRVSLWQMPYISSEAIQYEEAVRHNYIGRSAGAGQAGQIEQAEKIEQAEQTKRTGDSDFSARGYAGTIDLTNPQAKQWYRGLLKNLLDMGAACIKADFGEEIHTDALYHGMDAEKLQNLYPLLYQKTVFDLTREVTGEGMVWARAGWAGCQRYPVHWGGDAACTWEGMAGTLRGGLHLGLSGFGFWSHDVPGFHGLPDFMNSVIPEELYVRWTQFGVFTSHLRYHGTSKREPWNFPGVSDIVRKWLRLRYALLPYLLEQAEKVTRTGYPMLRSLVFHHAGDRQCWNIDDQYYFGDDLLVAPVMVPGNRRDVYLPEGTWVNFFTGETATGEKWLKDYRAPLHEMPVWARQGAEMPFCTKKLSCTDEYDEQAVHMVRFDGSFRGIDRSPVGKVLND